MARHHTLRALLLGLALFAAACAGGDDAVSTEAADSAGNASTEAAPADDTDSAEPESADDDHGGADDAMAGEGTTGADDAMAGDEATSDGADDGEQNSAPAGGPPPSLPPEEARAAAEQNVPNLQTSDDVRDIEVVSVYDGSVTSLREVVTGDRPVLLWFWAPH